MIFRQDVAPWAGSKQAGRARFPFGRSALCGLLIAVLHEASPAGPIAAEDWTPDTGESFGGRSEITGGEFVYWTEEPLATEQDDTDDQRIHYFQGFVPSTGPYELIASVRLPEGSFEAHDPDADLVPLYSLGIVASGLLDEGGETDLPTLRAAVVHADVPDLGIAAGDVVVIWDDTDDGPPAFVRIDPPVHAIDLRIAFDGVGEIAFAWRPGGDPGPWRQLASREVTPRGGPSARAELIGQSSNLLMERESAGAVSAFEVVFAPPRITSLAVGPSTGENVLTWNAVPGATYSVWASPGLGAWAPVATGIVAAGDAESLRHRPEEPEARFFYRVRRD